MKQKPQKITHLFCQGRESHCNSVAIDLSKSCNCSCYQLSLCMDGRSICQPPVFLNKESEIVMIVVDEAHFGLGLSSFTAYMERNLHSRAHQPAQTNITEVLEEYSDEISDGSFTSCRGHRKLKHRNKLYVVLLMHGFGVKGV